MEKRRKGEGGNCCLMGLEFQACKIKKSQDLLHNNVNILNTIEHLHLKMVKMVKFILCVFYLIPPRKKKARKGLGIHMRVNRPKVSKGQNII